MLASAHGKTGDASERYGGIAARLIQESGRPVGILQDMAGVMHEVTAAEEAVRSHPDTELAALRRPSTCSAYAVSAVRMDVDANAAGSAHQPPPAGGAGAGSTRGRRVAERLHGAQQTLQGAYRRLGEASEGSIAAEWLLDNYYLVERAVRLVRTSSRPNSSSGCRRCPAESSRDIHSCMRWRARSWPPANPTWTSTH